MTKANHNKHHAKYKRALRVRRKLHGTSTRPRMCVFKSNRHLSVQLIDDDAGVTLAGLGTCSKGLAGTDMGRKSRQAARRIGELIAEKAKEKNIQEVVFDRGSFKYHGVLAELADAARAGGLRF